MYHSHGSETFIASYICTYLQCSPVAQATNQEVQDQLVVCRCWVLEDHRDTQCAGGEGGTGMVEGWVDTVQTSMTDVWRVDLSMTEGLRMVQGDEHLC